MNLYFKENFRENIRSLMRKCGYTEMFDRRTGQTTFYRRLTQDHFPRFHINIKKDEPRELVFNLHLDMKKPSYAGQKAHAGEQESEVVKNEAGRIKGILEGLIRLPEKEKKKEEKSFWQKIFG